MSVVWKFPLRPWTPFIDMPRGARIVHAGVDGAAEACVWAVCDPRAPKEPRYVVFVPTGAEVPRHATTYVGSFTVLGTELLVFHVFEGSAVDQDGVITTAPIADAA